MTPWQEIKKEILTPLPDLMVAFVILALFLKLIIYLWSLEL